MEGVEGQGAAQGCAAAEAQEADVALSTVVVCEGTEARSSITYQLLHVLH